MIPDLGPLFTALGSGSATALLLRLLIGGWLSARRAFEDSTTKALSELQREMSDLRRLEDRVQRGEQDRKDGDAAQLRLVRKVDRISSQLDNLVGALSVRGIQVRAVPPLPDEDAVT